MSYRKTGIRSSSCRSLVTGMFFSGFAYALSAQTAIAAETPSGPTPPSSTLETSDDHPVSENPVIALVLDQLGVKTKVISTTANPADLATSQNSELTTDEKKKLASAPNNPPKIKKPTPKPLSKQKVKSAEPPIKTEAQALAAFYAQPGRQPVWVSKTGYLPKTTAVMNEFKHADAYGLRPRDFALTNSSQPALIGKLKNPTLATLAKLEISISKTALKYARYAKGGRIDPRKLSRFQDRGPILPDPEKTLATLAKTANPAQTLRSFHPRHPQFEALRKRLVRLSPSPDSASKSKKTTKLTFPASGPTLRIGTKHAHVALLRKRLRIKQSSYQNDPTRFDQDVEAGVKTFQNKNGLGEDGVVGPGTRRTLSGAATRKTSPEKLRARLLINMERWRWMPEKMQGKNNIFVWANVPELNVRIIREGKTVFTERAIAGQLSKQSPMFSDTMEWIEFNPTWYIPNSIKVADILPSLRGKGRVMSRYHLRIDCGKHGTDFTKIDWKKVDIRKCAVIQPTGAKSVLGKLKFKFPNKHAVYMHDTLTPGLFNRKHRILSHGCIRIRNPRRMAEVLLANDKGMSAQRVGSLLARGGLHTERLSRSIPVHITYFSTRVTKDGSLSNHPDYYGHDKRLAQAMLGKGHLFKGAIYSGRKKYKRKPRPKPTPSPSVNPAFFPEQ